MNDSRGAAFTPLHRANELESNDPKLKWQITLKRAEARAPLRQPLRPIKTLRIGE